LAPKKGNATPLNEVRIPKKRVAVSVSHARRSGARTVVQVILEVILNLALAWAIILTSLWYLGR
jgi:hypothetical protein